MRLSSFVVAASLSLAVTGVASAQSEIDPSTLDHHMLDRPMTIKAGEIEVGLSALHLRMSILDETATATSLTFGGSYGITDQLEAGLITGFNLDPESGWGEFLGINAAFAAHDTDQLDITPSLSLPLNFAEGADPVSFIGLGAASRFALNNQFAVLFGHGLIGMGIGDLSYVDINLNVALAAQLMPNLGLRIDTQLVSIAASGDFNETVSIADAIPLGLTALFAASPMIDIHVGVHIPDLGSAGDFMILNGGVLVHL